MTKFKNIIAVVNQKGGVGKTTSVINLATSLANKQNNVLVIDLDPQGNATTGSGIDKNSLSKSIYDVLISDADAAKAILRSESCGFDIMPANKNLAGAAVELVEVQDRQYRLKKALKPIIDKYDFVLIDCPPSLSLLTLNGLAVANHVLVPVQCEYYALEGLSDLLDTIKRVQQKINPDLELMGVVRTMFDKRSNLTRQVSEQLSQHFKKQLFETVIPRNVRLAEAPSFGMSAIALDRTSTGSQAYIKLAKELIKRLNHK